MPSDDPNYFDVRPIAHALTFVLGDGGWTVEHQEPDSMDREYRAHLRNGDAVLFLRRAYRERRLSVSGSFPNGYHPYGSGHSITVDPTRDVATLARDIERRLLPEYFAKLAEVLTTKATNEANKAQARQLATTLAAAFRCADPTKAERAAHPNPSTQVESWAFYLGRESYGIYQMEVTSYHPDRVTFKEITATLEQALQVAAIFRPNAKPNAKPKAGARVAKSRRRRPSTRS